ncbi:tape measure protein [Prevotellamassilia timonensis]|uniref:tape measure protein n=1 Tax=Prevotellamassilia timonensis TaxID=1852370 RepID=UPI0023F17B36|nr:tape measure protein [Prevotellamassilia timonensis]MDD7440104.1 tape measure protein [Prevotellamassilia timonensis]
MANLGNLFYEVQIKDSTSAGIKSIEDKIRKLNVAISPKIDVNGLNSALSAVSSKKGTELKLTVKADTKAIVADINSAISKNKFTAAVKANASSLAADIQSAINKGAYVAKVSVDTSGIKKAVQSAVGETIKVKTTQDTGKKSQLSEPAAQPARQAARPSAKSSANAVYLSGEWKEKVVTKSGWIPDLKSLYRGFYSTKSESGQQRYVEGIRQMLKNPYRVMTVRNLPEKGSERYKAWENEKALQRASRESDLKNAFKNADALSKAKETLAKISAYTSKGGQLSPELKNAQSALNRYVQTLENAKRVENKETRAPLLYDHINKAAASATTQLKALNAESAKQARVAAANRAALRVSLQKSSEPLSSAIGYIRNVNRSFPIGSAARDNAYNTLKPLIADVQRYRHEIRSNAINGTKADHATLSKLNSAVDALNSKMRQIDKVASNIKLSKLNAGGYARDLRNIVSEMQNVGSRGGWLRDQLQNIFSIYGAKQFLDNLIQIGGEFEKQKIALGALFGSKLKADTMYAKIQNLAVHSPFTFGELTNFTKQLASFGFEYKDIYDTTKRLADLSAGIGVDMGRVILAYGQVFTAKFLKGPELRQFTEAGIPLVQELANKYTKERGRNISAGDVYNMVSEKQVRFEDVKEIIDKYTSEGGKFYKMQEKLSDSVAGKWSNLKDSIEIAYSELETSNKGVLKGAISLLTKAILNWKLYGNVIMGAVAAYGLLAAKGRVAAFMSQRAASTSAMINQQTIAVRAQTEAYNELVVAMNKKNVSQGFYRADGSWYSGMAHRERRAAGREARRLILKGQSAANLTPLYMGAPQVNPTTGQRIISAKDKDWLNTYIRPAEGLNRKMAILNRHFVQMPNNLKKCGIGFRMIGLRAKMAFLSIKNTALMAASSIKAMLVSMWPMLALTAAFSLWANYKEDENMREDHAKDSMEGFKQAYKELKDFVDANPIEIAISSKNETQIADLVKAYTEQLRNSPINVDFALNHADSITDMAKRLKYLKKIAEEAAEAANKVKYNAASVSDAIDDETDDWGPDDQLHQNVKDYVQSLRDVEKESAKVSQDDMNEYLKKLDNNWGILLARNKTKQYKKDLEDLRGTLEYYKRIGDSKGFVKALMANDEKYGERSVQTMFGFGRSMDLQVALDHSKEQYQEFAADMASASAVIMEKLNSDSSAVVTETLNNGQKITALTDAGHMQMVSYIQDYANLHKLGAEETQAMIAEMESRYRASSDATWQQQSTAMDALMDLMQEKTKKLFEGKDLSKGFSQSQKEAINRMIDELPQQFDGYKAKLRQMCNAASSELMIRIGIRFNMLNTPQTAVVSNAQETFRTAFPTGSGDSVKYAHLAPTDPAMSTDEMIKGWQANIERDTERLRYLKTVTAKNKRNDQEIKNLENNIEMNKEALRRVNPWALSETEAKLNKKDNQAAEKARRAREKRQREKEKQLREYEKKKQEEYNQLKRVKDVFEKLRDLYGDVGALNKIKDSGLFKKDFIPDAAKTREEFVAAYKKMLVKLKGSIKPKSDALKKLIDEIEREKFDISFQVDKDKLDEQVKTLEAALDRAGDAWSRFKTLQEGGFTKELAGRFAFGQDYDNQNNANMADDLYAKLSLGINYKLPSGVEAWDDVLRMNTEEIKKAYGYNAEAYSPVLKLVEAYQKANKEIKSENDKLFTDLYKSSRDYAEKVNAVEKKKQKDVATIREQGQGYNELKAQYDETKTSLDFAKERLDYLKPETKEYKTQEKLIKKLEARFAKLNEKMGEKLPPDVVARLVGERNKQALEELGKLEWEEFQKGSDYMTFFQAVLSMSEQTMQSVYSTISGYLDKAFQDGKMSAKDYYDNLQKLDEQKEKKENDTTKGRKTFLEGRKGAAQWVVDHYKDAYESKMVAYKNASTARKDYELKNGDKIKSGYSYHRMELIGFKADEKRRKVEMEAAKTDLEAAKKHLKKIEETSQTIGKIQSDMGSLGSITGSWMQMTEGSVVNGQSSKAYKVARGANAAVAVAQDMLKAADSFNNGDIAGGAAALAEAIAASEGLMAQANHARSARRTAESNTAGTVASDLGKRASKYGIYTNVQDFAANYTKNNYGQFKNVSNVLRGISNNNGQEIINSMSNEKSKEALRKEGFDKATNISALGAEYAALVQQRDLMKEAAESERHGSSGDEAKAADYENQAAQLNEQINEFKSNVLKEIYGIDLTSFSNSLSSALVDAFKNGQDAAEAFANSVNNLLDTIVKNVIAQAVIMPEVEKLMKQIEDTYDLNDPDSIDNVIDLIAEWGDKIGTQLVENGEKIYKGVNERTGGKLSANGSSSSTSLSIKGLTEETGSLLASYINAIRADVSMSRDMLKQVVEVAFPQMNVLAEQQLKQLNAIVQQAKLIEANTRSNAEAAKNIQSALNSVLTLGNGGKAVRIKT